MPLRSAGAIENERLRGKVNIGIITISLSGTFKPVGLVPQKAADVDGVGDPTRDTYQRKILFDGTNFFLVYWESDDKQVKYIASSDGKTWTTPTVLWTFGVGPYNGGNADIAYPNRGTKDLNGDPVDFAIHYMGSNGAASYWAPFTISSQTLTEKAGGALGGQVQGQGGSLVSNLNGASDYCIFHRNTPDQVRLQRSPAVLVDTDTTVAHGGTTSGGCQILPYKTSSPYDMLALAKGSDNKLYYNIINVLTETFANSFQEIATLGSGFSDFCSCSEAQNAGDSERIHLVYIKSTGELCYIKFEDDSLGSETVLVASGASYPVIACGSNGKLYVFFVKGGKIWVIHFNGIFWLSAVELFTEDHVYDSPIYLSTNQNAQHDRICLVWTEGTSSPYEVWFCYLED